jgi:hypothetical protein
MEYVSTTKGRPAFAPARRSAPGLRSNFGGVGSARRREAATAEEGNATWPASRSLGEGWRNLVSLDKEHLESSILFECFESGKAERTLSLAPPFQNPPNILTGT